MPGTTELSTRRLRSAGMPAAGKAAFSTSAIPQSVPEGTHPFVRFGLPGPSM
ncbi:hypothetical protein [Spirillospora sp. NPDC047279]|uniref:hypothetical protein n=1 Tax=Spirillospora sp. NPDC047279 TaxID=3155478 RepID=UPI0033D88E6A